MSIVYLDIETIPGPNRPTIDDLKVPGNMKKAETIARWKEEQGAAMVEEMYHKQSLDSMQGQIFCIGCAVNDDPPQVFDSLDELVVFFDVNQPSAFVGHNIQRFDAKWLYRHLVQAGFRDVAGQFNFHPYNGDIHDTMLMWGCGDRQDHVSLDDLAQFLGVGRKTPGIDGSMVWGLVQAGEGQKVRDYCADDVELTRAVYKRLAWGL